MKEGFEKKEVAFDFVLRRGEVQGFFFVVVSSLTCLYSQVLSWSHVTPCPLGADRAIFSQQESERETKLESCDRFLLHQPSPPLRYTTTYRSFLPVPLIVPITILVHPGTPNPNRSNIPLPLLTSPSQTPTDRFRPIPLVLITDQIRFLFRRYF